MNAATQAKLVKEFKAANEGATDEMVQAMLLAAREAEKAKAVTTTKTGSKRVAAVKAAEKAVAVKEAKTAEAATKAKPTSNRSPRQDWYIVVKRQEADRFGTVRARIAQATGHYVTFTHLPSMQEPVAPVAAVEGEGDWVAYNWTLATGLRTTSLQGANALAKTWELGTKVPAALQGDGYLRRYASLHDSLAAFAPEPATEGETAAA